MSKMIQIRNVPDSLHRKLKVKAASEGTSLSGYLLRMIRRGAAELSMDEWLENNSRQPRTTVPPGSIVELIRQGRQGLDRS